MKEIQQNTQKQISCQALKSLNFRSNESRPKYFFTLFNRTSFRIFVCENTSFILSSNTLTPIAIAIKINKYQFIRKTDSVLCHSTKSIGKTSTVTKFINTVESSQFTISLPFSLRSIVALKCVESAY